MGQTLGRAPLPSGCRRFLNLPRSCIYDLWEAFNDIAEGFGLTIEEFQEILKSALMEYLGVTERVLNTDTDKVFQIFDDDQVFFRMLNDVVHIVVVVDVCRLSFILRVLYCLLY